MYVADGMVSIKWGSVPLLSGGTRIHTTRHGSAVKSCTLTGMTSAILTPHGGTISQIPSLRLVVTALRGRGGRGRSRTCGRGRGRRRRRRHSRGRRPERHILADGLFETSDRLTPNDLLHLLQ